MNKVGIPLEGHFLDINGLVSAKDDQNGDYDFPCDDLESFTIFP